MGHDSDVLVVPAAAPAPAVLPASVPLRERHDNHHADTQHHHDDVHPHHLSHRRRSLDERSDASLLAASSISSGSSADVNASPLPSHDLQDQVERLTAEKVALESALETMTRLLEKMEASRSADDEAEQAARAEHSNTLAGERHARREAEARIERLEQRLQRESLLREHAEAEAERLKSKLREAKAVYRETDDLLTQLRAEYQTLKSEYDQLAAAAGLAAAAPVAAATATITTAPPRSRSQSRSQSPGSGSSTPSDGRSPLGHASSSDNVDRLSMSLPASRLRVMSASAGAGAGMCASRSSIASRRRSSDAHSPRQPKPRHLTLASTEPDFRTRSSSWAGRDPRSGGSRRASCPTGANAVPLISPLSAQSYTRARSHSPAQAPGSGLPSPSSDASSPFPRSLTNVIYHCEECGEAFATPPLLRRHILSHQK